MKKIIALVLALAMVLTLSVAFADPEPKANTHNVVISNNDQNVPHTYEGYQVFKGNLNATQNTLSDIKWGDGIVPATLLENLIAANNASGVLNGEFEGITASSTPYDVAMKISGWANSTGLNQSAKKVDAFAAVVANSLSTTKVTFSPDSSGEKYSTSVNTDGYYFIKDVTTNLEGTNGSDTLSKYLIRITDDTDIVAKDTGSHSNKVIVEGNSTQNDNNKNIGDTITYKSTVNPLPNPRKYNTFKLTMEDELEKGLTFTGISSVTIADKTLTFGTDYYYIIDGVTYDSGLAAGEEDATHIREAFEAPSNPVGNTGDHTNKTTLRVVFKNAKELIIGNSADGAEPQYAGATLTVNYTAVLNADAELAPDSNDNKMKYKFSNNPNYDYDGDDWKPNEPFGVTPEKTVETYTTALQILKVDGNDQPLAGATFTITATDVFNVVRETGDTFVVDNTDEAKYWKLLDGSYTTTNPDDIPDPQTQYESTTTKYKKVSYTDTIVKPDTDANKVYTVTSGADGIIRLEGIKAGTYTVTEIAAPDGYNGLKGEVFVQIGWTTVHGDDWAVSSDKGFGGFEILSTRGTEDFKDAAFQMNKEKYKGDVNEPVEVVSKIQIKNQAGALLPSTGGIGTTIFYILGGLLVIGAAVILVARRKAQD